ncbi:MAG: hypothetical protein JWO50_742 [Candidatus Kaiserbacteria bacterium]|nr:hypothetical protein [Candidatus Kaiserbacteria bacterium]
MEDSNSRWIAPYTLSKRIPRPTLEPSVKFYIEEEAFHFHGMPLFVSGFGEESTSSHKPFAMLDQYSVVLSESPSHLL